MARKRMIDPDFWSDEKLGNCTRDERLLFMGLISNADDEGRGRANQRLVKATVFPYDDDLDIDTIKSMLQALCKLKLIVLYEADGQEFYFLPNFTKHQSINRPSPSKLPAPDKDSMSNQEQLTDDSLNTHGGLTPKRKEKKRNNICSSHEAQVNDFFEEIWLLYPKKRGKSKVKPKQRENLCEIGKEQLLKAIDRYKADIEGVDEKYVQYGSTFFNGGFEDYLDENYEPPAKGQVTPQYRRVD